MVEIDEDGLATTEDLKDLENRLTWKIVVGLGAMGGLIGGLVAAFG